MSWMVSAIQDFFCLMARQRCFILLKDFKGVVLIYILFVNLQEIRDKSEYTQNRYMSALRKKTFPEVDDVYRSLCYRRKF